MTKKDYILIANALTIVRPDAQEKLCSLQWSKDCEAVAHALYADNPSFNFETFYKACKQ